MHDLCVTTEKKKLQCFLYIDMWKLKLIIELLGANQIASYYYQSSQCLSCTMTSIVDGAWHNPYAKTMQNKLHNHLNGKLVWELDAHYFLVRGPTSFAPREAIQF